MRLHCERKGVKGSETVDHVACKYWCALQGSGVIKIIINLTESHRKLYMGQHTWCRDGTTLVSLSFYAHYSASIHFLPKLFGTCHLFVILNIQCKFRLIL